MPEDLSFMLNIQFKLKLPNSTLMLPFQVSKIQVKEIVFQLSRFQVPKLGIKSLSLKIQVSGFRQ